MREITCCFTGHRKISADKIPFVRRNLREAIYAACTEGYRRFVCGGALGFDTMAAIEVLSFKKMFSDIRLILIYPCLDQDRKWSEEDKTIYKKIYEMCDECYAMSEKYTDSCMHLRNRAMVDQSSKVIAYLKNDKSGTAYTYNYAQKRGVDCINIADWGE